MKRQFSREESDDPLIKRELWVSRDAGWLTVRVIGTTKGLSVDFTFELDDEALAELREVLR